VTSVSGMGFLVAAIALAYQARAQSALPKAQPRYEVAVSWAPPASSPDPVAGYDVLRAPAGVAGYVLLNPAPLPVTDTSYLDLTEAAGQDYDYVVESVDAEGVTSAMSNSAPATVPATLPAATITGNTT
jgi:hypothetical protein